MVRDLAEAELDAWMSRLSEGQREAFDPLFRALYPRALRLARAKLADDDDDHAADVAQAIMMKVFARASEFEAGRPLLPWFYAIAANEIHTGHRQRAVAQKRNGGDPETLADSLPDEGDSSDPERVMLARELRESLARAIASLDDDSAAVIASLLNEGERPPIRASAFRKRVSRAYARLRLLLGGLA